MRRLPRSKEQPVTDDRRGTQPRSPREEKEVDAAAYAAGAIGGRAGDEDVDPVERPLQEAGEGVAEGFELAEEDLIEAAETGVTWVDPVRRGFLRNPRTDPDRLTVSLTTSSHRSCPTTTGDLRRAAQAIRLRRLLKPGVAGIRLGAP